MQTHKFGILIKSLDGFSNKSCYKVFSKKIISRLLTVKIRMKIISWFLTVKQSSPTHLIVLLQNSDNVSVCVKPCAILKFYIFIYWFYPIHSYNCVCELRCHLNVLCLQFTSKAIFRAEVKPSSAFTTISKMEQETETYSDLRVRPSIVPSFSCHNWPYVSSTALYFLTFQSLTLKY